MHIRMVSFLLIINMFLLQEVKINANINTEQSIFAYRVCLIYINNILTYGYHVSKN